MFLGECVSGALHWKELVQLSKEVGFCGPYLVTARPFEVEPKLRKPLGRSCEMFHFVSNLEIDTAKRRELLDRCIKHTGPVFSLEMLANTINTPISKN